MPIDLRRRLRFNFRIWGKVNANHGLLTLVVALPLAGCLAEPHTEAVWDRTPGLGEVLVTAEETGIPLRNGSAAKAQLGGSVSSRTACSTALNS